MDFTYKGKPIIPTKTVLDELNKINMDLNEVPEILENIRERIYIKKKKEKHHRKGNPKRS